MFERGADGGATLQVEARDNERRADVRPEVSGPLRAADRPARRSGGRALPEVGGGIYRGSAPLIAPGQWDLVLEGDAAGQRMFLSKNRVLLN